MQYRWKESIYNIKVLNPEGNNTGITRVILNGEEVENNIRLDGKRNIYNIHVIM